MKSEVLVIRIALMIGEVEVLLDILLLSFLYVFLYAFEGSNPFRFLGFESFLWEEIGVGVVIGYGKVFI